MAKEVALICYSYKLQKLVRAAFLLRLHTPPPAFVMPPVSAASLRAQAADIAPCTPYEGLNGAIWIKEEKGQKQKRSLAWHMLV
ncbi:hypothetical protein ACSS6W_000714 [Trichoderma asperelloides]